MPPSIDCFLLLKLTPCIATILSLRLQRAAGISKSKAEFLVAWKKDMPGLRVVMVLLAKDMGTSWREELSEKGSYGGIFGLMGALDGFS